ncbi:hypothetical protein ABPG72_008340 [Tetrahymena utriculariae]
MRSSSGFNRTSYSPPRVYPPTQIPVQQQYVSRLPPQTSTYTRSQVSYPGIIGGTQYLHPQAGLSSIPSSRPLGSSVLTIPAPVSYNNFVDQRPISYQTASYSPPRIIQAPSIATSTVANQLPAQIQASYKQANPLDGSYYNTNAFEQSQIQKTMNTTQVVRKFNNTSTHVAAQNSDQINEIQLDRIKVYKKANVEKFFGRDVTIDCNYEPQKLFSSKELRGFLVNGFQEFEQNLKKLEQRFSGLESSFYHLLHKGDTPKDMFDRFLVTLDKRVEKFFESFDESVIQGRGLAADYFDTSVLRNDYEFWNFRSVVKQGVIEISNKLNDLFVARENSTYYDAQIIRSIETIIKLYSFLKSDLNTILNKSILKCGKILEACTYFYENGEGLKTINFADYIQLDVASLISQYSEEFDRTYPVLLNKKQIVTEKFHDILKDKSTQNQFDLKQLVRSVFQRERRKLYRTIYNSIVNNGKNEIELSEDMLSLNKTITDKMNKIKSKYLTIKNDPLFMEVLTGRMNVEYLKNSPTLFEENSQTVLLLEKFMVNTQQFYEDIKDALSDIIYYKQKEQDKNKDILQGILSKAVYDLNQQEKIIQVRQLNYFNYIIQIQQQDKGDMSELILYQFQVLEKSLSSDHNRQNIDTNLESTLMKQLKNNQTNYHLHNVAADLARQEKQREEQRKAMKDNQFQKTKEFSSQIANLMTKPMIDKERNMYPVKVHILIIILCLIFNKQFKKDNKYDQYDVDDRDYDQSSSLKGLADKLLQTIKQKREEELEKERKLKEEQEEIRYMKEQQYKEERERMQLEKQRMVESTSKKFQERREQEQAELQQRIQMRQLQNNFQQNEILIKILIQLFKRDEKERRERELDRQREEDYKKQRQNEEKQKLREEEERQRKARDEDLKQKKLQDEENRKQKDEELKRQRDLELKKQRDEDQRKQQLEQEIKMQQQAEQEKRKQAELEKRKKAEEEENKRIEEQRKRDQQKKIEQEELKKKQEQEEQKRKEEQRIKDEQFRLQQEELQKKKEQEEQKRKEEQKIRDEQLRAQQEEQKKRLEEEQKKRIQQQQEEEMRKKKLQEELELKKKEEEGQRKKQQELDRQKKEEEERIKKIEEQKRKDQMEQDRLKKEEEEKKKKLEEQKRKEQQEQERLQKEQEEKLKKIKQEEEEKERKRLEEKQKEEQNKKAQKGSGFNYDDIGGSEQSGSQYGGEDFEIDDYDEILGKDNSKNKKANEASKNNKGFDQDELYEEIAEDSDNFNDFMGKLNKPAAANTNNNVKKPEPAQSKVKNDKYDDFEDLDDNFDDFDDEGLEDKKKIEQPPAKTSLPSLSNNTKKAEDSKRSNNLNSYEDDFEDFDDFSDMKKKEDPKPAQLPQEQKKSDKKPDIDYFEDIEEDIDVLMGDTSNNKNDKSGNNISKTNPTTTAATAKQTTQQPLQDKNKKQSNFDYDLDFDDEDHDKQDDLEKDFKQDVEKQPQKNNRPAQKSKENEYDYDFDDEDEDEDFQQNQNPNPDQMTQEQMEQMMQAEQEREHQNMELTYGLIQKTNDYVKKTRFGRSNKANLSNYNSYDCVIRLYEEYIQNLQVFLFDFPESMKLLDLYEASMNQQNEFEQLIEEYADEIQKIYYENTQMTGFATTTKLYFPLEANSIGFQLIEVNLMNQTVSYFYMVDENEESLIQQLNEFHTFYTLALGLEEFQASLVKVEDNTLKILQIYEQEHYLQYMCMLFPLVYEFMSDIADIMIDQNTIDRIFYIQLSLELFYTELETNEEQVTEKFNQLLEQYCNHKEFAVNIQDYQEFQNESLEQILNDMNQFKESILQSEEQKYGLVMFSIQAGEVPFCFYFYVAKSADDKTPHEIGLFCLSMSDQINNTMVEYFDQLQEENVVFRPHVDATRHNGLYAYREFTIATWAHLIEKKNLSPFIALNIINFSMIPYYITYKGLD